MKTLILAISCWKGLKCGPFNHLALLCAEVCPLWLDQFWSILEIKIYCLSLGIYTVLSDFKVALNTDSLFMVMLIFMWDYFSHKFLIHLLSLACLLQVCKRMDMICQRVLNQGFLKVERYHSLCQRQVKAQLPRSVSHCLKFCTTNPCNEVKSTWWWYSRGSAHDKINMHTMGGSGYISRLRSEVDSTPSLWLQLRFAKDSFVVVEHWNICVCISLY